MNCEVEFQTVSGNGSSAHRSHRKGRWCGPGAWGTTHNALCGAGSPSIYQTSATCKQAEQLAAAAKTYVVVVVVVLVVVVVVVVVDVVVVVVLQKTHAEYAYYKR